MRFSDHFSEAELTITSVRRYANTPGPEARANLEERLAPGLETVRAILGGRPLHINSAFRSVQVNKVVGGARNSAHIDGCAADFICPDFGDPLAICRALVAAVREHAAASDAREAGEPAPRFPPHPFGFDQLIEEGTWVHISFDPRMRGEVLTKIPGVAGYHRGLRED